MSTLRLVGGLDGESPRGLVCRQRDDPARLMAERGLDQGVASVVVDFLRLEGTPGCRISELLAWCETEPCTPIVQHRQCIDLDLSGAADVLDVADALTEALSGRVVTRDAPTGAGADPHDRGGAGVRGRSRPG